MTKEERTIWINCQSKKDAKKLFNKLKSVIEELGSENAMFYGDIELVLQALSLRNIREHSLNIKRSQYVVDKCL